MNLHVSPQRATDDVLMQPNLRLRIGEHVIDIGALRIVTRPDLPRLTSKAVAVLIELVRHVGSTVKRDELFDRVWTGRFPTPDVLTQAIKELRRAFADDSKPPRYIETIPKVGYRLIAPVLVLDGPDGGIFVESRSTSLHDDDAGPSIEQGSEAAMSIHGQPGVAHTWKKWLLPAFAVIAVALAIGLIAGRVFLPKADKPMWRVSDVHALTSDPGSEYRPQLSPDGTRVAFSIFDPQSKFERIVVRSVEPSQLVHLTAGGTHIEGLPMWSPDGTQIAFERLAPNYCEMFVAPSLGGSEREIGTCQNANYNYYDWTPDGRSLVASERRGGNPGDLKLFQWDLGSGEKHDLKYARAPDDQDLAPRYSPDGRRIAFRRGVSPYSDLYVMASSGGAVQQVTHLSASIRGYTWTSDNSSLVFSSTYKGMPALYAVDVDSGHLQPLDIGPAQYPNASRTNDAIVYEITRTQEKLTLMSFAEGENASRVLAPSTGSDSMPALSPSGDRVVFVSNRSGQNQLWVYDRSSGTTSQLTERAEAAVFSARWSSDGKKVIAVRRDASGRTLVEIDMASRRQRVLSAPDESIMYGAYGVDPDSYLLAVGTSGRAARLIKVDHPGTPSETRKTLLTGVAYAHVDPGTRSVYYTSNIAQGLFRCNLDTGSEQFVTPRISAETMDGWRVVDGHLWYLSDFGVRTATMRDFDPASGSDRVVTKLDALMEGPSFSVMPARDGIIFAPVDIEDTDVGMFRLDRAQGS